MREKAIKDGPLALRVLLVVILVAMWAGGGGVYADTPNPVRSLPEAVTPGQEFEVTVTFTAPQDGFTIVSLSDRAPDGWTVTVNTAWCTPAAALADTPQTNLADYLWGMLDTYDRNTAFTAVYKVQVPVGAETGEYAFELAGFQYFIQVDGDLTGPFHADTGGEHKLQAISGDDEMDEIQNDDESVTASYELTIDSTQGGTATTLGEGTSPYDPGTVLNLTAEADEGYRFVNWTGDVDTIADVNADQTTITVHGDHSVTANFVEVTGPPVAWTLIGGIAGSAAAAGLIIFFRLRRRTF